MNLIKIISSSFLLKIIFTISLFILIFISSVSYRNSVALAESTAWVMHSYKINVHLERLFSLVKDAETGQRGFIITRDSAYLISYFSATEKINGIIH
jgi:CHASE3 domain sensor protein